MKNPIRPEVLEHNSYPVLGDAIIASPLPVKFLAAFVALIVVCLIGLLFWGRYARKQTVQGYIMPNKGLIKVYTPQNGIVVERDVEAGDKVKKGEKLFTISAERSTVHTPDVNAALVRGAQVEMKSLQAQVQASRQIEKVKIAKLHAQTQALRMDLDKLQAEAKTETELLKITRKNMRRYRILTSKGLVSDSRSQQEYQKVLIQKAKVQALEKSMASVQSQISQVPTQISAVKADTVNQVAALHNRIAQLDQKLVQLHANQKIVIRAPADGVVSGVLAYVGQNAEDAAPLITLLPKRSIFQARLLVPSRAIGFVKPGQDVLLRYRAFSYQHFGLYHGKVLRVFNAILSPRDLHVPLAMTQPVYMVTVALRYPYVRAFGKHMPLQTGMTLSADIVLDHRSLIQWILEPLYSARGHL